MNRTIKFRAWHARIKEMFNVDVLAISECAWSCPDFGKQGVSLAYQSHIPVMQFTGLVDKNGVEIYDGDIISFGNRLYEVATNFKGYYLQRYKLWNGEFKPAFTYAMSLITRPIQNGDRGENGGIVDSAEVIGNIYQNPELVSKLQTHAGW